MGEPFLWAHANPRQECLGGFTQLFDTGGGAWGPGTAGGTFSRFCRRMEIGERPICPGVSGCWRRRDSGSASRNSPNRWIAAACSGPHFTPSCSAFLTPERCSGANVPNMSGSSFRDGDVSAWGGKISYGCPRYCLARWTSSPEESRKALHGQVTRICESP